MPKQALIEKQTEHFFYGRPILSDIPDKTSNNVNDV